uniref:Uncharacterized protein n=1 Tax=Arundo donax TaxID=35708 RepID=A0A0A9EQU3_ARUDO
MDKKHSPPVGSNDLA